jgi:diguanylate cyclase (GGDEF)-like protein
MIDNKADSENHEEIEPSLNIDDLDTIKKLTDTRIIEMASGDITTQIIEDEMVLQAVGKKTGSYYRDIIFALIQIRLPEEEAKRDWYEILTHKYTISEKLNRNVGIHVAALDYYTNIKKRVNNPTIVNTKEYIDTASRALTDDLTRAYSRHFFDEEIRRLFYASQEKDESFSLIMLDLDYFKIYNDLNGHIRGDLVLIEAVRILHAVCSREDTVARYGGEEFAVLLPHQQRDRAIEKAENIRQAIADYRFVNEGQMPQGFLTASLGVTSYRDSFNSPTVMIEEADRLLYLAKNEGRNRVKASDIPVHEESI